MDQETFSAVDAFIGETLVPHDEAVQAALDAAEAAGLPQIQVSPPQGKLLGILAGMVGARKALEFGTLGGYSTILLARALPEGGQLVTLEANAEYAEVARANIERAGLRTYPYRPAASRARCARLKAIRPLASCSRARWFSSFLDQRTRMPRLRLNHE
jgi:predicted O-methyltransferase YrrM